MPILDCSPYIAQAKSVGITDDQIAAFRAANTNADGSWDCHRLVEAFYGVREQQAGQVSVAQAAAVASLPPIAQSITTGGDQRMFLSLSNVPTTSGGGAPARQLAPIVAAGSPMFGSSLFSLTTPSGGLDIMKIVLLAGVGFAAWHFLRKRG